MTYLNPQKHFGQNYLIDKNIPKKISAFISPKVDDHFVEIGPGHGALTDEIYKVCFNITAIEIDKDVIPELQIKFPKIKIVASDFLKLKLNDVSSDNHKLRFIGNIPYNITSPIFFKLIEWREKIEDATFMIQNEVAKRIVAKSHSKEYGILSVILNFFAEVNYGFKVSPNVFFPRPKVDSAVIRIKFKEDNNNCLDPSLFINVVKAAFNYRRKTLKNSFNAGSFSHIDFKDSTIDLNKRAEELEVEDFILLTNYIFGKTKRNY